MPRTTPPGTAIVQARWSARHSSARHRASARRAPARWTGSGPEPAPAPAHNVRLPRSFHGSPTSLRRARHGPLLLVIVLPVALLLQRVGDVLGHVGFIMLGEHGVGLEHAGAIERAFGDHALAFAEQIGENSLVGHRQGGAAVG